MTTRRPAPCTLVRHAKRAFHDSGTTKPLFSALTCPLAKPVPPSSVSQSCGDATRLPRRSGLVRVCEFTPVKEHRSGNPHPALSQRERERWGRVPPVFLARDVDSCIRRYATVSQRCGDPHPGPLPEGEGALGPRSARFSCAGRWLVHSPLRPESDRHRVRSFDRAFVLASGTFISVSGFADCDEYCAVACRKGGRPMPRLRSVAHAPFWSAAIVAVGITLWISRSVAASPPKDERQLELTFQVVDADSGRPVAGTGRSGVPVSR